MKEFSKNRNFLAVSGLDKIAMEALAARTDAELMERVKDGDDGSFTYLLSKHRDSVVNYMYRMVHNAAIAEELAQEVFLRVYRARKTYVPSAKFTTWLYRIATHVALNFLRDGRYARNWQPLEDARTGAVQQLRDPEPSIEDSLVADARRREIRQAVLGLPAKQRAAVILHKYQELDYKQIAQALQCSESAVKSLLFRAYETLRGRLSHLAGGRS